MKEEKVITTHLDEIKDYDWLSYSTGGDDISFVADAKTAAEAAKLWKMTPEAVAAIKEALAFMSETIIERVAEDLKDLFEAIHAK